MRRAAAALAWVGFNLCTAEEKTLHAGVPGGTDAHVFVTFKCINNDTSCLTVL